MREGWRVSVKLASWKYARWAVRGKSGHHCDYGSSCERKRGTVFLTRGEVLAVMEAYGKRFECRTVEIGEGFRALDETRRAR
jgi:hypothetical protein